MRAACPSPTPRSGVRPATPGFPPLSERLALVPGTLSPGLAALAVQFGTELPFGRASTLLAAATGTVVSPSTIRSLTERAGAAWCQVELALVDVLEAAALDPDAAPVMVPDAVPVAADAVLHLGIDGAMVPLVGGIWAEVRTLAIGEVTRQEDGVTTTALSYASHLTDAATFGRLSLVELMRRGVPEHPTVVAVTDGAPWIQELLDLQCPQAVRILDMPHAAGYLAQAAQASFGPGTAQTSEWFATHRHALRHGNPDTVLEALVALPPSAERETALGYLTARRAMVAYADWDEAGYPVGSGCVESANKLVVEARLKGPGMHWRRDNADALVALRAVVASGRWEAVWPRIVSAMRANQRDGARQRREERTRQRAEETAATVGPRPKLVIDGKPTATHPWKQFPTCSGGVQTRHATKN